MWCNGCWTSQVFGGKGDRSIDTLVSGFRGRRQIHLFLQTRNTRALQNDAQFLTEHFRKQDEKEEDGQCVYHGDETVDVEQQAGVRSREEVGVEDLDDVQDAWIRVADSER
jgi:hypothetical protein